MYFPAGSRLTWVGTFGAVSFIGSSGVGDEIAGAATFLKNNYDLIIETSSEDVGALGFGSGTITLGVLTNQDRSDISDVQGNIDDAFKMQNSAPESSRIVDYKLAGDSSVTSTGAAPAPPPNSGSASTSSVSNWWNSLTTKISAGTTGFAVGAVAVLGLLIWIGVRE